MVWAKTDSQILGAFFLVASCNYKFEEKVLLVSSDLISIFSVNLISVNITQLASSFKEVLFSNP